MVERPKAPQASSSKKRTEVNGERFKTKMCEKWVAAGACPYNDLCMFAHGKEELRTTAINKKEGITNEEAIWKFKKTVGSGGGPGSGGGAGGSGAETSTDAPDTNPSKGKKRRSGDRGGGGGGDGSSATTPVVAPAVVSGEVTPLTTVPTADPWLHQRNKTDGEEGSNFVVTSKEYLPVPASPPTPWRQDETALVASEGHETTIAEEADDQGRRHHEFAVNLLEEEEENAAGHVPSSVVLPPATAPLFAPPSAHGAGSVESSHNTATPSLGDSGLGSNAMPPAAAPAGTTTDQAESGPGSAFGGPPGCVAVQVVGAGGVLQTAYAPTTGPGSPAQPETTQIAYLPIVIGPGTQQQQQQQLYMQPQQSTQPALVPIGSHYATPHYQGHPAAQSAFSQGNQPTTQPQPQTGGVIYVQPQQMLTTPQVMYVPRHQ